MKRRSPPDPALLALADGSVYRGHAFGAPVVGAGEVCFNTSITGYQEILTDPSYAGQIVAMTYTQIGNVGVNREDEESRQPFLQGFVVKEVFHEPSSWRSEESLDAYMRRHGIPGISGIDTRALVRRIRDGGAQVGVLSADPAEQDADALVARARSAPGLDGRDLAVEVTCDAHYSWSDGRWAGIEGQLPAAERPTTTYKLVAFDFGLKRNIARLLVEHGFDVTVVPAHTSAEQVLALEPQALFLSNGPGDPAGVEGVQETVRVLAQELPVFGICLGHQILGLALGGKTVKLKFGHHGGNQPGQDLATKKVAICAENHGYAVDADSLREAGEPVTITHVNLNDGTVEGLAHETRPIFSVQYHPEASPGPHDADYFFRRFREMVERHVAGENVTGAQIAAGRKGEWAVPRRDDIESILVLGAGPIVIGQACEFDYSGSQGCKALREEGYRVVLVNSNPATIMTDPDFADRTYIEPMTVESVEKIIARDRPDVILPTLGGQTALNLTIDLAEEGVLDHYGVGLIGAQLDSIHKAEDRDQFREAMRNIGLKLPASGYARSIEDARRILETTGLPAIIRPSFTLGGTGGSVAFTDDEFEPLVDWALRQSPKHTCLVEQSVLGWKEYELEVMRDAADNVVIICSIENFDAMGVHTGDSITVAPAQTLTDREYQEMRDASIAIIREIGVDTGGSNIQFGVDPKDGTLVVIEMNPRVSRSSALASKATGFPIAKIAAKLAVGYTLDEIRNDITRETPASFEPSIDYVVSKVPRFTFEKFPGVDSTLTTQMKSVGEVMAIGRTFKESLQKAIRSLEIGHAGFEPPDLPEGEAGEKALWAQIDTPRPGRLWAVAEALRRGTSIEELHRRSWLDPWFLRNLRDIVEMEADLAAAAPDERGGWLRPAKQMGFSDRRLAALWGTDEARVRALRGELDVRPVYKRVDTCAAEFEAHTPYLYSTYEDECEARPSDRRKIVILGGGPNRIGQGIEFDYCCVHASFALGEAGCETIMVNCNPETVSTDYDTSDRLYFEPLTLEDVLAIVEKEQPEGVIVQFGGQTPLRLAVPLERAGVPILGTPPDAIDRAEDRERFEALLEKLGLKRPPAGLARSPEEAEAVAERIGYPVLVRPSYVLGGRAMEIVHDVASLRDYMKYAVKASPEHPVLVDRFLADATEVDVDAISDGERVVIGGVMEHIEQAGVHSGDSACSIPPYSLTQPVIEEILASTRRLALELGVRGLMNVQYAVKDSGLYVIEVNPRASRTIPFVSKAIGKPLAKLAALVMSGVSLEELGFTEEIWPRHYSVKEAVFPFVKFPGADTLLGPEMKSTGEVMGIDSDFGRAYAKAQIQAGNSLPVGGTLLVSVKRDDQESVGQAVSELASRGFRVLATRGTAETLERLGVEVKAVPKVGESREGEPDTVQCIEAGEVDLVINTVGSDPRAVRDSASIRRTALLRGIPYFTTAAGVRAAVGAIRALQLGSIGVRPLQEIHGL